METVIFNKNLNPYCEIYNYDGCYKCKNNYIFIEENKIYVNLKIIII